MGEYQPYVEDEHTIRSKIKGNSRYKDVSSTSQIKDQKQAIPDLGLYRDDEPASDNDEDSNATLARLQVEKKILRDKHLSIQLQSKKGSSWRKLSQNSGVLNNS